MAVIVPIYNEEAVAKGNIEMILRHVMELPTPATLIVVNDGSTDKTESILKELSFRHTQQSFKLVSYSDNRGYGGACKAGASFAISQDYDYAVFMDSDLTDHPRYLNAFYEKMREGWDYIKTTRHTREGGYNGVPWNRRLISSAGCILGRWITGLPLTDMANGFRAVKIEVLRHLELKENGFGIIMEELIKSKKHASRYCEISRIQGVRSRDARPSLFHYDAKTLWSYLKHLLYSD